MSPTLARTSGMAGLLGGVLVALSALLEFVYVWPGRFSEAAVKSIYVPVVALELAGVGLILLGLAGLYERQADRIGALGFVGFLIAFFGTVLLSGFAYLLTFMVPAIAKSTPAFLEGRPSGTLLFGLLLAFRVLALGYLVFGIASFRAGVLPRGAAALVIVGAILSAFPPDPAFAGVGVIGLGVSWLRYGLWTASSARTIARPAAMG